MAVPVLDDSLHQDPCLRPTPLARTDATGLKQPLPADPDWRGTGLALGRDIPPPAAVNCRAYVRRGSA